MESFRPRLQKGGLVGSWCTFASFASAEVMASLGFDFLVFDLQHCEVTQAQFPALLGAAGALPAVVRAPQNDYQLAARSGRGGGAGADGELPGGGAAGGGGGEVSAGGAAQLQGL